MRTTAPVGNPAAQPQLQRQRRGGRTATIAVSVIVVVVILLFAGGYAVGWFRTANNNSGGTGGCTLPSAGILTGDGSTLVAPLVDQWATSYWTGSIVTYDASGSSSGIQAITSKTVDFGASDAPLNPAQLAAAPGILQIPEAGGGVVPIYNLPGVSAELNFNGSVLAQIFDGTLINWNNTPLQKLNAGVVLPNASIAPVYRTGGSGTTFIFTSFLTLESTMWATSYGKNLSWPSGLPGVGASGNGGVATTVETTTNSISYVDLNYALNSAVGPEVGKVQNPSGTFIRATVATTESALADLHVTLPGGGASWYNVSFLNAPGSADYPITSLTYLLVFQDLSAAYGGWSAGQAENLVDFVSWVITTGQTWSGELYYAPLPASVVAVDNTTIASMTFGGSPVTLCIPTGGGVPT